MEELGGRAADVWVWRNRALEARCRLCLKRGMELGSPGGALRACRCGVMGGRELWSSAAGVQTWRQGVRGLRRCADVERYGARELGMYASGVQT